MIQVQSVSKSFGELVVLKNFTQDFDEHRTHILLGVSGCGKSTLLRLMTGLLEPDEGKVFLQDMNMQEIPKAKRSQLYGYVTQSAALFPHLTAQENVELPGRVVGMPLAQRHSRTKFLAELTQMDESFLERYPFQLSGGQQQRLCLMRALFLDPPILMMDEPLSALDPIIRSQLQIDLKRIFDKLNKTVIFVTHDLREAHLLGHQIYLMNQGSIEQQGRMRDFFKEPATDFVKEFVSSQTLKALE